MFYGHSYREANLKLGLLCASLATVVAADKQPINKVASHGNGVRAPGWTSENYEVT